MTAPDGLLLTFEDQGPSTSKVDGFCALGPRINVLVRVLQDRQI